MRAKKLWKSWTNSRLSFCFFLGGGKKKKIESLFKPDDSKPPLPPPKTKTATGRVIETHLSKWRADDDGSYFFKQQGSLIWEANQFLPSFSVLLLRNSSQNWIRTWGRDSVKTLMQKCVFYSILFYSSFIFLLYLGSIIIILKIINK
jgi:hypothetical protein